MAIISPVLRQFITIACCKLIINDNCVLELDYQWNTELLQVVKNISCSKFIFRRMQCETTNYFIRSFDPSFHVYHRNCQNSNVGKIQSFTSPPNIGNLLTLSYGLSDGWISINLIELKSENTTLSTGPLTMEQLSLVISISNIGGIIGNLAIVPISRAIGIKRAIHLFVIPLIVSECSKYQ